MKPGFNALELGEEWDADVPAGRHAVAEMGFAGIETGVPSTLPEADELKAGLDESGLTPVTGHLSFERLRDSFGIVVEAAHRVGLVNLTISWSLFDSMEYIGLAAKWSNDFGRRLKREGLRLHYHNHAHELALFGGRVGLDLLYERTDPECLSAHPDTYWLKKGGQDPVAWLKRMRGRCPLLHLKDMDVNGDFCELGGGVLDLAAICEEAKAGGTEWVIYEQDKPGRLSPWDSVKASAAEMRRLGLMDPPCPCGGVPPY